MKKKKYLLLMLLLFAAFINNVYATGYEISVTSNTVTVGNSITLRIKGDNLAGKFTASNSNNSVLSLLNSSVFVDNNTQEISIKAKSPGTATITINPADVTSYDSEPITNKKTIQITVKDKPKPKPGNNGGGNHYQRPKSSNNNLSSLTIEGLELQEKFDQELTEYSVLVPADTEKIKINGQLADSNAKVSGLGEVEVSEGLNTFEIIVTAENGSKRKYTLKATVEELKPIIVKIDDQELTIVRKRKDLPKISEYFVEKDIEINEEKVEGYYSEKLNYTLVGLKDKEGEINYYIYQNDKYTKYNEYVFNGTTLYVLDKEVPQTKKASFEYDGKKVSSYQEVKLDYLKNTYALDNNDIQGNDFYLFYAKNIETGKESLYQYDAVDKTVQRYNTLILDQYKNRSDKYYVLLLSSLLLLGITIVIFSTILIKKSKKSNSHSKKIVKSKDIDKLLENNLNQEDDELPIKEAKSSPKKVTSNNKKSKKNK